MSKKNIATLIMAAGSSSRMGTPKQLLPWKNATLIENVIAKALQLNTSKTLVVLGANKDVIIKKIASYPIEVVHNKKWHKGLGNSIAFGINHILSTYKAEAVLIVLADQPLIKGSYLEEMLDIFEASTAQIIATRYQNGKTGVPVLFDKSYFEELSVIDGDNGAKEILRNYSNSVKTLLFEANVFDIDTEEDYNKLLKS